MVHLANLFDDLNVFKCFAAKKIDRETNMRPPKMVFSMFSSLEMEIVLCLFVKRA